MVPSSLSCSLLSLRVSAIKTNVDMAGTCPELHEDSNSLSCLFDAASNEIGRSALLVDSTAGTTPVLSSPLAPFANQEHIHELTCPTSPAIVNMTIGLFKGEDDNQIRFVKHIPSDNNDGYQPFNSATYNNDCKSKMITCI